jgi:hypothetical protein
MNNQNQLTKRNPKLSSYILSTMYVYAIIILKNQSWIPPIINLLMKAFFILSQGKGNIYIFSYIANISKVTYFSLLL